MRVHPVCVALDLETTGLHPEQDAIIEVGAVKFAGDRVLDTFSSLVAPGMPLPYRIQRLTGITPAELRAAPTFAAIAPRLRTFLGDHTLVGHNVPFDVAFLRRVNVAQRNPLLDTYELASALLPNLANYTLGSVSEALNVTVEAAHRALADARMTFGVFSALLARLEGLDDAVVEALAALPAGNDWTPSVLVRALMRERGLALTRPARTDAAPANPFASLLGAQIGRSLGMNPAVLSMAVAADEGDAATEARSAGESAEIEALAAENRPAALRERIAAWATDGGPLLIEGDGTEAGLLDALVPLCVWAAQTGERVLLAAMDTESVERLTRIVIPAALAQLAAEGQDVADLSVAFLAEPEAYLCTHRWLDGAREAEHADLSREVVRGLAKLVLWAPTTRSGWRGEVALSGAEAQAWERARYGAEHLDQVTHCAYHRAGYCFGPRAQAAAAGARILVTTHTALASVLGGAPSLLTIPNRVLVLDAHFFEEELRRVRTTTLDRQDLLATLDTLAATVASDAAETSGAKGSGQRASRRAGLFHLAAQQIEAAGKTPRERAWFDTVKATRAAAERFFAATISLLAEANEQSGDGKRGDEPLEQRVLRLDAQARQLAGWEGVAGAWTDLARCVSTLIDCARDVAAMLRSLGPDSAATTHVANRIAGDLYGSAWRLERLCQTLDRNLAASEPANEVAWLRIPYPQQDASGGASSRSRLGTSGKPRAHGQNGHSQPGEERAAGNAPSHASESAEAPRMPTLQAAPIAVGAALADLCANSRGLALASPALSVAGEFDHVRALFGLPGETPAVPCQPDYTEQTLLALPSDVPEPNAPHFQQHLESALIELARALDGRLVAIFPSHAALRASYAGIRRALERHDIQVLAQGQDGSARQLWRTFHSEPRTVLLGAGVFWGGHEQRAHPPVCIVVARLPFPAMGDPLLAARANQWDDPQAQYVVPQVALKTRQALNGLAWSHGRRNAVVLFDRRVQTRGYGPTILATLPRCTQHSDPIARLTERIAEWVEPAPRG